MKNRRDREYVYNPNYISQSVSQSGDREQRYLAEAMKSLGMMKKTAVPAWVSVQHLKFYKIMYLHL